MYDSAPAAAEFKTLVMNHMLELRREFGEIRCISRMRKHLLWYLRAFHGVEDFRHRLFKRDDASFVIEESDRFLSCDPVRLDLESAEQEHRELLFRQRVLYWTTSLRQVEG